MRGGFEWEIDGEIEDHGILIRIYWERDASGVKGLMQVGGICDFSKMIKDVVGSMEIEKKSLSLTSVTGYQFSLRVVIFGCLKQAVTRAWKVAL